MVRYHVRYAVVPGVQIPADFYVHFNDSERDREIVARVQDPVPKEQRKGIPPMLAIDLQFDADTLSSALHESHRLAGSVAAMLSLMSCTGLPAPALRFAFDFSEDRTDHDFIQIVDLPLSRALARTVDTGSLNGLGAAIGALGEDAQGAAFRAMRWISHANEERNYLFRFLANWFALESLEPRLVKRLGIHPKPTRRREEPQTPGVAAFVETLKDIPPGFYDEARRLRNDLVHGSVRLGARGEDAKGLNPDLASVAFRALAFVAGWTPPRGLPAHVVFAGAPRRVSLRTRVFADRPGFFGPSEGEAPHFDEGLVIRAAANLREERPAVIPDPNALGPTMMAGVRFGPAALTVHSLEVDWADVNVVPVGRGE